LLTTPKSIPCEALAQNRQHAFGIDDVVERHQRVIGVADTALVLAHVDLAEKSNEIPAAQALLADLGVTPGAIVTLDARLCANKGFY